MTTRTRTQSADGAYEANGWNTLSGAVYRWFRPAYSDTITYELGPKRIDGRCNWKSCVHVSSGKVTGELAIITQRDRYNAKNETTWLPRPKLGLTPVLPAYEFDTSTFQNISDQLNLNCQDSVLLYSGILQAVPLVGGCFKFVNILNRIGRKISKGMRKQPFTTVIKSCINADFIDRFVISPTIDDARKFLDAHNYVVRVMDTAYQRNAMPFALKSQSQTIFSKSTSSGTTNRNDGFARIFYDTETVVSGHSSLFMLLEAGYDTRAIDPIKLWATRLGINRPLDSVWDLIPFSFIVDYFTRAGDFIAGLGDKVSSQEGLTGKVSNILGCYQTTKVSNSSVMKATDYKYASDGTITRWTPSTMTYESTRFTRGPLLNPWQVFDTIQRNEPFFRFDLSPTKVRTLLELVIQSKL